MRKSAIFLISIILLAWSGFCEEVKITLPAVGITSVEVSKDRVYLLSYPLSKFYIVDFKGKILRTFGRKGSGPGEFMKPRGFSLKPGEIWIYDFLNSRIQVFDHKGNFLRSIKFQHFPIYNAFTIGESFYYSSFIREENGGMKVLLYRKGQQRETSLISVPVNFPVGESFLFPPPDFPVFMGLRDKIIMVSIEEGTITVYDKDGKEVSKIKTNLKRHKVTPSWKKKFLKENKKMVDMLKSRGVKIKFREKFPAVRKVYRFGGCVVLKEWSPEPLSAYHMYTLKGKQVKKLELKSQVLNFSYPYWIEKNEGEDSTALILHPLKIKECEE